MSHQCRLVKKNREMLDACCQYGADVDVRERDGILAHKEQIKQLLDPAVREEEWFTVDEIDDEDFPSGRHVRTTRFQDVCVFLAHDKRGCAIHRASIEGGWDFRGIKPHICRLFPITFETDAIVLSDDYDDYSCAGTPGAKSVYEVSRSDLGEIFGLELVSALDKVERQVLTRIGVRYRQSVDA